ncbi:MAG: hypothetical protein ACYC9O_02490 [Candidatus Latescibacterota bacterium]
MKKLPFILVAITCTAAAISTPAEILPRTQKSPGEQRQWEEQYDYRNIRRVAAMQTDASPEMLAVPSEYSGWRDFEIAKTPPVVHFAIVQGLDPWYLRSFDSITGGFYGGWNGVTRGPDGCFYFSIGNHYSYGADARIIRYDPVKKEQRVVLSSKDLMGWKPDEFGDAKLHGDLDVGPGGDIWALTYFGPAPSETEWNTKYRGGWLIHYNIFSGRSENLGIPLEGESWPMHVYDGDRGLLFGVGHSGKVIAYDTRDRKMLYGAAPAEGIRWASRVTLLDPDTGVIYSSDAKPPYHFVSYTRRNNRFTILKSTVPENPAAKKASTFRTYTKAKDAAGAFWCMSQNGALFRFFPDEDRVDPAGLNWGPSGEYAAGMVLSPDKRYFYYIPGAQTGAFKWGTPVVQYDTKSGRKKVIAFLRDYYLQKYGYGPGGAYGIELDPEGKSLFFYTNGRFTTLEKGCSYGRPAIYHIEIPESERNP